MSGTPSASSVRRRRKCRLSETSCYKHITRLRTATTCTKRGGKPILGLLLAASLTTALPRQKFRPRDPGTRAELGQAVAVAAAEVAAAAVGATAAPMTGGASVAGVSTRS